MPATIYILAALSGWAFDEYCGTGPRPIPGPHPDPWWWIRKLLAVVGGIGAVILLRDIIGPDKPEAVATILTAGVGGTFLGSLGGMVFGRGRALDAR